jgi:glycerol-3-phosphate O-acyltransferase
MVRAGMIRQSSVERLLTQEAIGRVVASVTGRPAPPVDEVLSETLFHERARLDHSTSRATAQERAFYAHVRRRLPHAQREEQEALLQEVVTRYGNEIAGHFDPRAYVVATRVLPIGLGVFLHNFTPPEVLRHLEELPELPDIADRLLFDGDVDVLRQLVVRGTVILVPTHSSNLDSLLLGLAIYELGLPPFVYGAGLNLFSNPMIGWFMHNLGAYTVDRLKTDPLYRQVLKEYATVSLEQGQHNLYFPGGTRSRSGGVEAHLKKGLLGTSVAAFRNNLLHGHARPRIFVVPCTCTYPLVLEAETLIRDSLQAEGKGRYIIVDDEFSRVRRWIAFLRGILRLDLQVHVIVGKPLDPFGNKVDASGRSFDPQGREIDPARYLMADGAVVDDPVRDAEYTRTLANRLVDTYHRDTVALPTHVLAYAFLELLRRQSPQTHLYRFLRSLDQDTSLPVQEVEAAVGQLVCELCAAADAGRIRLSPPVREHDVARVTEEALAAFSTYHTSPVVERCGERLHVRDAELLFYYRNRLDGRGLLGAPPLLPSRVSP